MTTTYSSTSCNSENIVACLVNGEELLHACISSQQVIANSFNFGAIEKLIRTSHFKIALEIILLTMLNAQY